MSDPQPLRCASAIPVDTPTGPIVVRCQLEHRHQGPHLTKTPRRRWVDNR